MDKRLSIALLLTAIIVAVTPILFPTPRRATSPTVSAPAQKTAPPVVESNQPAAGQTTPSAAIPPAVIPSADSVTAAPPGTVPATTASEITTVTTATSTYQFTNVGAAPVSVSFRDYKSLTPGGGPVNLKAPGQPLLQYALVTNGTTIPLSSVPFQLASSGNAAGDQVLTYRAAVSGVDVVISYDIVPGKYVVRIGGKVEGATGQTYLL